MKNTFILLLTLAAPLHAATIYHIDLGNSTQTTAGNYNNMSAATAAAPNNITGLVDSNNASSTINIVYSVTGSVAMAGTGANWTGAYPATVSSQPASALQDGLYIKPGATATLTFSGLDNALTYDFVVYGARGNNGGGVLYTIGANSGSISNVFENASTAISFTGISPTAGVITLDALGTGTAGNDGALNYVQLTAVPEPSSAALLGLGGLALILRRRK